MKTYRYSLNLALLLLTTPVVYVSAQGILINEVFDYPVGMLETSAVWENFDGPGSLLSVVEGSLAYDGYGTIQGNKVLLDGDEGFNLLARRFEAQTSGTVYGAALVRIDQGVPGLQANRFVSLNVTPRLVNVTVLGDGADGEAFRLCVSKANVNSGCTGALALGTYLVVFSYTFNPGEGDDVARLWVNPDLDQPEPAPAAQESDGGDVETISEVVLEQNTDLEVVEVDDLRVATTWAALGTDAMPTATEQEDVPAAFILSPIYPNPFNPEARFTLTVGRTQPVRLAVYDVLGREVDVLHEGVLAGGQTHSFTFAAAALPSGTYLLKATGETFTATRQALLVK